VGQSDFSRAIIDCCRARIRFREMPNRKIVDRLSCVFEKKAVDLVESQKETTTQIVTANGVEVLIF
jgi:hypothetical protein